jgi:hypothetical protein
MNERRWQSFAFLFDLKNPNDWAGGCMDSISDRFESSEDDWGLRIWVRNWTVVTRDLVLALSHSL